MNAGLAMSAAKPTTGPCQDRPEQVVDDLLRSLELGSFVDIGLPEPTGRNKSYVGGTESGQAVFVKVLSGSLEEKARRLRRSETFQRFVEREVSSLHAPRLIGVDERYGVLVFEYLAETRSVRDLADDGPLDEEVATRVGEAIGALHRASPAEYELDTSYPDYPPRESLRALSVSAFENCSAASLQAWSLMQRDRLLCAAVEAMLVRDEATVLTAAHCDLRFDQMLLCNDQMYLVDGEEFRLAEPARDLGSLVGQWLHRAVSAIPAVAGGELSDVPLTHEAVLGAGEAEIEKFRSNVFALHTGYRAVRGVLPDQFVVECASYAGWHLVDRMLAAAEQRSVLGPVERAAAGIGRTLMSAPEQFVAVLGLDR